MIETAQHLIKILSPEIIRQARENSLLNALGVELYAMTAGLEAILVNSRRLAEMQVETIPEIELHSGETEDSREDLTDTMSVLVQRQLNGVELFYIACSNAVKVLKTLNPDLQLKSVTDMFFQHLDALYDVVRINGSLNIFRFEEWDKDENAQSSLYPTVKKYLASGSPAISLNELETCSKSLRSIFKNNFALTELEIAKERFLDKTERRR